MHTVSTRSRVMRSALVMVVGLGIFRASFWAPEVCPVLTVPEARSSVLDAADWIAANQFADGSFRYDWHRNDDETSGAYNEVRHAGVTMSLYQLVEAGEEQYLPVADAGLEWMLEQLVDVGDGGAALQIGARNPKLGASSLLAAGLSLRRRATGETAYDTELRQLGRFLVGQQRADGSMLNFYDVDARAPVPDETSVFATGEALWAIAMLHRDFGDIDYEAEALLTLDYLATARDLDEGFMPQPWPDQWAAYSLAEMADWGLSDDHIDYARRLAERFAFLVRFDSQRGTVYGNLTHGFAPRGGAVGTWLEGLAGMHQVAVTDPRLADIAEPIGDALACGAAILADRQVTGPRVRAEENGAWFYADLTRMDDQQHAASGILLAEAVLPATP